MYNPLTYWRNRKQPAPNELPDYAADYITRHIKDAKTILDFGIGEGRLLTLYKGKDVTGYDIVQRDIPVRYTLSLETGFYDVVIASKVLLHIKPENISSVINMLRGLTDKVIVYDTVGKCKAPHNFNHDFESLVEMNDVIIKDKELLFWYA